MYMYISYVICQSWHQIVKVKHLVTKNKKLSFINYTATLRFIINKKILLFITIY